jgi:hypothetical protein
MVRAAVLIGVSRTGGLDPLQAVKSSIERMRTWAEDQPGMKGRVTVLSDTEGAKVTAGEIRKAIQDFVALGTVEQLVVYFSGHGANVMYNELWLLSDAPADPQAAVNLAGSTTLARHCGIPHVVFISDACRTAATSLQAQMVQGSIVFPNTGAHHDPGCVDTFFAAPVGHPSLEVLDAAIGAYRAVYTEVLVDTLAEHQPGVAERVQGAAPPVLRVRPRPLRDHLERAVPKRMRDMEVDANLIRSPDAVITSDPDAWLAELKPAGDGVGRIPAGGHKNAHAHTGTDGAVNTGGWGGVPTLPEPPSRLVPKPPSVQVLSSSLISTAIANAQGGATPPAVFGPQSSPEPSGAVPGSDLLEHSLDIALKGPEPRTFETRCGFRVRGASVIQAVGRDWPAEVLGPRNSGNEAGEDQDYAVRVYPGEGDGSDVLLVLEDGNGVLLPALPGFVGSLVFDKRELASVSYEPVEGTDRWHLLWSEGRFERLRELRSTVAAASRMGTFRLADNEQAKTLIEQMRSAKGLDPSLSVYAAYALHERAAQGQIADMETYIVQDLRLRLFDVALLAEPPSPAPRILADARPGVPMLTQGWPLLAAQGVQLEPGFENLHRHVLPSLWTMFDRGGVDQIRDAFRDGGMHGTH